MSTKKKMVPKKDVLSLTKCPRGSFRHISKKMGFPSLDSEIIDGRYTLLYHHKIIRAMAVRYGWKGKGKDSQGK